MDPGKKVLIVIVVLTSLLTSAAGYTQEALGIVVASRGGVNVISNGENKPLRQGDFIHLNDRIEVSNRSFAVLQFMDGAKVTLRPETSMLIEQYLFTGGDEDTATLSLTSGGIRVSAGAIANNHPENYTIRTPSAVLRIDGPEGSLTLCDNSLCDQQGLVEVKN